MAKYNFIMIGRPASGKTSYIVSAYSVLKDGVGLELSTYRKLLASKIEQYFKESGMVVSTIYNKWLKGIIDKQIKYKYQTGKFRIQTNSIEENNLFEQLSDNLKKGQYPSATNKMNKYCFEFLYNGHPLFDFEWTDIVGGMMFSNRKLDAKTLQNAMKQSQGLMIFFDSKDVLDNKIDNEMRSILTLITRNLGGIESPFCINIVLTKYDLIEPDDFDIAQSQINLIANVASANPHIQFNVVKISCTEKGFYNVEIPMLNMASFFLKNGLQANNDDLRIQTENLIFCKKKSGIWDDIVSAIGSEKSYRKLAEEKENEICDIKAKITLEEEAKNVLNYYLESHNLKYK